MAVWGRVFEKLLKKVQKKYNFQYIWKKRGRKIKISSRLLVARVQIVEKNCCFFGLPRKDRVRKWPPLIHVGEELFNCRERF